MFWKHLLLTCVFLIRSKVEGGFANLQCPTVLNSSILPCNDDCQINHGASYGNCGNASNGDYNCYCGSFTKAGDVFPFVQCQNSSIPILGPLIQAGYAAVCNVDCQCNHGAVSGTCDFVYQRCGCGTLGDGYCPYGTIDALLNFLSVIDATLSALLGVPCGLAFG